MSSEARDKAQMHAEFDRAATSDSGSARQVRKNQIIQSCANTDKLFSCSTRACSHPAKTLMPTTPISIRLAAISSLTNIKIITM